VLRELLREVVWLRQVVGSLPGERQAGGHRGGQLERPPELIVVLLQIMQTFCTCRMQIDEDKVGGGGGGRGGGGLLVLLLVSLTPES